MAQAADELEALKKDVESKAVTIKHLQNALEAKSMTIGILSKASKEGGNIEDHIATAMQGKLDALAKSKDEEIRALQAGGGGNSSAIRSQLEADFAKEREQFSRDLRALQERVRKTAEGQEEAVKAAVSELEGQLNLARRGEAQLLKTAAEHKDKHKQSEERRTFLETKLQALETHKEELLQTVKSAQEQRSQHMNEANALRTEKFALQAELAKAKAATSSASGANFEAVAQKVAEAEKKVSDAEKKASDAVSELRVYQTKAIELKGTSDALSAQLESSNEELQSLQVEHQQELDRLNKELEMLQTERDVQWKAVTEQVDARVKEVRQAAAAEKEGLRSEQAGERERERQRLQKLTEEVDRLRLKCDAQDLELRGLREAVGDDGSPKKSVQRAEADASNEAEQADKAEDKSSKARALREQSQFAFDEMTKRIAEVREEVADEKKKMEAEFEQTIKERGAEIMKLTNSNDSLQTQVETLERARDALTTQRDNLLDQIKDCEQDAMLASAELEGVREGTRLAETRLGAVMLGRTLQKGVVAPAFSLFRQSWSAAQAASMEELERQARDTIGANERRTREAERSAVFAFRQNSNKEEDDSTAAPETSTGAGNAMEDVDEEDEDAGKKIVVLSGPPGAGKSTQASRISDALGIPVLCTDAMLESAILEGNQIGLQAKTAMDSGDAVPDSLLIDLVKDRLESDDCIDGFILDGFPGTVAQATALDTMLDEAGEKVSHVVSLSMPDDELFARIQGRWVHKESGRSYHVKFKPPKSCKGVPVPTAETMMDDATGEQLVQRSEDTMEGFKARLEYYHAETVPILEYYDPVDIVSEVEGSQEPDEVWLGIAGCLDVEIEDTYGVDDEGQESWAEMMREATMNALFIGTDFVVENAGKAAGDLTEMVCNITGSLDLFPTMHAQQLKELDRSGKGKELREFIHVLRRAMERCQRISSAIAELCGRNEEVTSQLQNTIRVKGLEWNLKSLRAAGQYEILIRLLRHQASKYKEDAEIVMEDYGEKCEENGEMQDKIEELEGKVKDLEVQLKNAQETASNVAKESSASASSPAPPQRSNSVMLAADMPQTLEGLQQMLKSIEKGVMGDAPAAAAATEAPALEPGKGKGKKGKAKGPPLPGAGPPPEAPTEAPPAAPEPEAAPAPAGGKGKKGKAKGPPLPGAGPPPEAPSEALPAAPEPEAAPAPAGGKGKKGKAKGPPLPGAGPPPEAPSEAPPAATEPEAAAKPAGKGKKGKGPPPPGAKAAGAEESPAVAEAGGKGPKGPPPPGGKGPPPPGGKGPPAPGGKGPAGPAPKGGAKGKGKGKDKGGPPVDPGPAPPKDMQPKKFHWQGVAAARYETSIFARIAEEKEKEKENAAAPPAPGQRRPRKVEVDLDILTSYFFQAKSSGPSPEELAKAAAGSKKKAFATCLEQKKSQGVEIFLNGCGVTLDMVMGLVVQCDEQAISAENLEKVIEVYPNAEELQQLREFEKTNDPKELPYARAETFCLALMNTKDFTIRAECCLTKGKFREEFDGINQDVLCIKNCLGSLVNSKGLPGIFALVMQMGNYLNFGSNKGAQRGFSLDSLQLLMRVEGFNDKTYSLMRFLMDTLEGHKALRDEALVDMELCDQGSKLDFDEAQRQLGQLEGKVRKVSSFIKPVDEAAGPDSPSRLADAKFEAVMRAFVENAEKELSTLREQANQAVETQKKLGDLFVEKKGTPIAETLSKFAAFRKDMEEARRQNLLARAKKEKAEKARANKEAAEKKKAAAKAAKEAKAASSASPKKSAASKPDSSPKNAGEASPTSMQMKKMHVSIPQKPLLSVPHSKRHVAESKTPRESAGPDRKTPAEAPAVMLGRQTLGPGQRPEVLLGMGRMSVGTPSTHDVGQGRMSMGAPRQKPGLSMGMPRQQAEVPTLDDMKKLLLGPPQSSKKM